MKKCIICGGDFFDIPIISLNNMPESAQGFLDNKEDNHSITLNLVQCKWCGTIQFDCAAVDYYKDVIRAGGYTKTMSDIREKQFNEFINKFNLDNKKILEIGCGKGEFLNILSKFNVKCYGIENNIDNANTARMSGLEVKNMFLDDEKSIIDDGPFDA
ncbi:methionine biosynthesis protein MetW, partial [Brachyspira innocens]|uniref:methyltransferase domain-containing protein n=1 Tax=Brachyspira innocens TaxID=13264 RepID=UPI0026EAA6F0